MVIVSTAVMMMATTRAQVDHKKLAARLIKFLRIRKYSKGNAINSCNGPGGPEIAQYY